MTFNENARKHLVLFLSLLYLVFCVIFPKITNATYMIFALIPTAIIGVFLELKNKRIFTFIIAGFLCAFAFTGSSIIDMAFVLFFMFMAFVISNTLKTGNSMFRKGTFVFLVMLISAFLLFFIIDLLMDGPSFFESLNNIMADSKFLKELSLAIERSSGRETIDLSSVDSNVLKVVVTSLIPVIMVVSVGFLSFLNFSFISVLMNKHNRFIKRVSYPWEMSFPKTLSQVMVLLVFAAFLMSGPLGDFGAGIFMSMFMLAAIMFMVQGSFLLSYLLKKIKFNNVLNIVLTIIGFFFISITSLGSLLLINAGFVDLVFNIRKLNRKSVK